MSRTLDRLTQLGSHAPFEERSVESLLMYALCSEHQGKNFVAEFIRALAHEAEVMLTALHAERITDEELETALYGHRRKLEVAAELVSRAFKETAQ